MTPRQQFHPSSRHARGEDAGAAHRIAGALGPGDDSDRSERGTQAPRGTINLSLVFTVALVGASIVGVFLLAYWLRR